MRLLNLMVLIYIAVLSTSCHPERKKANELDYDKENNYDSTKAAKYGADIYGMKKYVMAFLSKGTNDKLSKDSAAILQQAHLKNINRLAKEGKLVLAGPFFGNQDLRGIYVFNLESIEEARILTQTDPSVQAGLLEMELIEWYGSAALIDLNEIHKTLAKKGITD